MPLWLAAGLMHRLVEAARTQLLWRLPLYRSYFFYVRTCRNYLDPILYVQRRRPFYTFHLRNGMTLQFANPEESLIIYKDVWLDRIYTKHFRGAGPRVVVDIGANVGTFTLYAKERWPSSRVLAYEPSPENFRLLTSNVQTSGVDGVTLHEAAVAAGDGHLRLFLSPWTGRNTVISDGSEEPEITVRSVGLPSILREAGGRIDYLKIDCEGGEWEFFQEREDLLRRHVLYVAMEYHETAGRTREQMVALFERAGFTCLSTPPDQWSNGMLFATNACPEQAGEAAW